METIDTPETSQVLPEEQQLQQPPASTSKKMKVLVAVDQTDDSFYALKWVLDNLFRHTSSAELEQNHLILLHVVQIYVPYIFPGAPAVFPTTSVMGPVTKIQKENAAALLARASQICREKNIVAESKILEGADPKEIICQTTEEMKVDLLVVGSRGLGKIKRALLGSVSDYCTHHAKCAVLIVKPPKDSATKTRS